MAIVCGYSTACYADLGAGPSNKYKVQDLFSVSDVCGPQHLCECSLVHYVGSFCSAWLPVTACVCVRLCPSTCLAGLRPALDPFSLAARCVNGSGAV